MMNKNALDLSIDGDGYMKIFFTRKTLTALSALLLLGVLNTAHAKRFTNEYTEFELPTGWECVLEGSEWVCQSTNEERKKEAIIILVAKIRGEQDSIDQYMAYLKQTKTYALPGGKSQVSEPKYAKVNEIKTHRWVDSLHLASEVPGFYTRYLATVKEDLGVAITFSVAKEQYTAYQGVFDKVVASMSVFRQAQKSLTTVRKKDDDLFESEALPDAQGQFTNANTAVEKTTNKKAGGGQDNMMLIGIVAAVAGAGFVIMKRKKK
jgi:LPXTG-motif cell wall-anchored protein